jgi:PAS domain S-box-containing protein
MPAKKSGDQLKKALSLRFYNSLSYQKKLLIFMMSMVVFVSGTMGLLIRFIILPHLTHEMESHAIGVANRLAESTRTFILTRDRIGLTASLFEEKRLQKNIAYILVTDDENRVLAHTFVGTVPDLDPAVRREPDGHSSPAFSSVALASRGQISDIVAPVQEGLHQIGAIRMGLDKGYINRVIHELNLYHLGFMGFITVLSLICGLYLSRVVTRPITLLTRLAGEVSLGNLDTRISMGNRERCWEVLQCKKQECPAYGNEALPCWFVDDTRCSIDPFRRFPKKLEVCHDCPLYENQVGDEIVQLADAFNHMTQRLRDSERELRCSEERYRLLFDHDPNPVFVLALDSTLILDANDRAAQAYGYPKETLVGMEFTDLGFQDDAAEILASFAILAREARQCTMLSRIRHRRQGGDTFWVNIHSCRHEHLEKPGMIVTTTDITEVINTETNLIQAGKMATLGEMATGVAHELNQPLNAIKLGSEFLRTMVDQGRAVPDQDLHAVSREISQEVDRAAKIITHLRDFGRKSNIDKQRIDINQPIRGAFTLLGQQLRVHAIQVITELQEGLPPVLADENRIEQVLINLITNARDAMEAKREQGSSASGNILTVRSFPESDRVVVTVGDTGTGIPHELRQRIFEPFFTTKEVGRGTGLGLSISYGIVRDYEGTIEVETTQGAGTTFKLSFPGAAEDRCDG